MKKRRIELSAASVTLMLLVIFIHVISECVSGFDHSSVQFAAAISLHRLSSFAVQGFIFLSGLKLFLKTDGFNLGRFWLGRLRRVVIPYVVAFSIFYIYFIVRKLVTPSVSGFVGELLRGGLVNHFYFVVIICQFYLLIPLWRLIVNKASPILSLTVSLILMLILRVYLPEMTKLLFGAEFKYNSRLFTTYLFYFVAGAFAGKYYDRFKEFLAERKRGIYALFAVVGLIDCFAVWVIESGRSWLSWADMLHVLYCIAAILALMCFSIRITSNDNSAAVKAVRVIDPASYNVYLIHPLFIFMAESLLHKMGVSSLSLRFVFKFVFTYVLSIGLCVLLDRLKKRIFSKKA